MKRYGSGRALAALIYGILFGLYVHFDEMRWSVRGREAFLDYENRRFDKSIMHPHTEFVSIIVYVIVVGIGYGLFELIAAGITQILPASTVEEL